MCIGQMYKHIYHLLYDTCVMHNKEDELPYGNWGIDDSEQVHDGIVFGFKLHIVIDDRRELI